MNRLGNSRHTSKSFSIDVPRNTFSFRKAWKDLSFWSLLISNLIAIFFAIIEDWNLINVLWIYWFQSIIMIFFNYKRILRLKTFSTKGFEIGDTSAQTPTQIKNYTASGFLLIQLIAFGIFFIFLLIGSFKNIYGSFSLHSSDIIFTLASCLVFFLNHRFSYLYNTPKKTDHINIGSLFLYYTFRIIPMHLILLLGAFLPFTLFFLAIKTLIDLWMHAICTPRNQKRKKSEEEN